MEYTIQKLAQLAGVTTRTLRYYDQIGLLHPARVNSAGYRFYGGYETDRLQQILFYRELGLGLDQIRELLESPGFDDIKVLRSHRRRLLEKKQQIDELLQTVDTTIWAKERNIPMNDELKFKGFKQQLIEENEERFGWEAREKYGDDAVNSANQNLMGLNQEEYNKMQVLSEAILHHLDNAYPSGDPTCETAQQAAALHKEWLSFTWSSYSKEAHAGLANMYVDDERFAAYYDRGQPGKAKFLRDAILFYLERK